MKDLSRIALEVHASTTLQVDALYKKMKSEGIDVVGFAAGEPDFNTPSNIKEAAIKAINHNQTKYTPASGLLSLRQAVVNRLKADCNLDYTPEQIVVASGAKHNIYITLCSLINSGDEVILPAPYWVTYDEVIKMVGGIPVIINAKESDDFKINSKQLEANITDKTKLLILCNPSNPTGMLYSANELKALIDICIKHDLYIISDEIYYQFVYDNKKFTSVAALSEEAKERTIIINGVSKTYAMTGWRIGYSASNFTIAKTMGNYLSNSTSAPSTISQLAAEEALNGPQNSVYEMRDIFKERRDYIVNRINNIKDVSCSKPDGAFYVMLNIEKLIGRELGGRIINNSDDFAMAFLEKGLVATVSCIGFGCKDFIRLTYAASMEDIIKGMDRLEKFIGTKDK
ncbi:MAG: pyridoxal phosphate-dependent aminotransferase [Oscillospiraceae bacterium]|jgi:aspartate aminotransferase|nr:pyridoxal phosphate-dependent aminotransferase [Oscillospiraceae bacterium]